MVPVRPPPYLYTSANIQRFQQDLKDIFLSAKTSITRNYLRFLVERITVTGKRVEISLKREAAPSEGIARTLNAAQLQSD